MTVAFGWRAIAAWVPQLERPGVIALSVNALVLVLVAVVAGWIPARHASTVDPVAVLKSD